MRVHARPVGKHVNGRLRIVVCDQDPAVNAAVGHLLGVAFSTPALFGGRLPRVSVEVLGEYLVDSSLMAPVQGEPFAARPFKQWSLGARPTAAVTFSGIHEDADIRSVIDELGVPVTCLSGLAEAEERDALDRFACGRDESCNECVTKPGVSGLDSVTLAEACRDFARLVAEGVTDEGSGE
jgi:hypothetical protein